MTAPTLPEAMSLYESLKKEFFASKPDYNKCGTLLAQLKIALTQLSFLLPASGQPDQKEVLLAREVLEIGALWSIRVKDIPSFERYMAQLKTYYTDYSKTLPPSQRMYTLLGLDLLRYLSQNRISEFHSALELIDPDTLSNNVYIKHPIQLEQNLMEGSYNKVWNSRVDVPAEEYLFFIDILMGTIRNEIASCSEKSYTSLPLADAASLLFFKNIDELVKFANERNWNVNPSTKQIHFKSDSESEKESIPSVTVMSQSYHYAKELERIV
ncbi:COP9 signalosome [Paraphysoderma sedebokerense]|nr:COP9 signalosome [Paraphysoderma sedebokerense]